MYILSAIFENCFFREIEEYMNDKVHFVITNSDWDKNFDDVRANFVITFINCT